MFFLERHVKKLKGSIYQNPKPKGYVVEGYIIHETVIGNGLEVEW